MKVRYFGHDYDCKLLRVMRSRVRVRFCRGREYGNIERTVSVSADRLTISYADRAAIIDQSDSLTLGGSGACMKPDDWLHLVALAKGAGVWPDFGIGI